MLCAWRGSRPAAGVFAPWFGVHCFAANASVNSPLRCWALDGECERLWKSLWTRTNGSSTNAIGACAIHQVGSSGKIFCAILFAVTGTNHTARPSKDGQQITLTSAERRDATPCDVAQADAWRATTLSFRSRPPDLPCMISFSGNRCPAVRRQSRLPPQPPGCWRVLCTTRQWVLRDCSARLLAVVTACYVHD